MPVTSVAELINLLAARRQVSILHDRRTGMPYSWSSWLRTRASKALSAFATTDVVQVMAARAPAPTPGVPAPVPLWRIIVAMFWHGGEPPPRDQRGTRWFAGFISAGLHLLFALLLLWVAMVRSNVPEDTGEQGERVQVEYIGRGTPDQQGGGAPASTVQAAAQTGAAASGETAATDAPTAEPAPAPDAAAQAMASAAASMADAEADSMPVDAAKPAPAPPETSEQPLQVTETPLPTRDFVLPPPQVAEVVTRQQVPQVRERSIETVTEQPVVTRPVLKSNVELRQPAMPEVQVRERQIEVAPQQAVVMTPTRTASREVQVRSPDIGVREREVQVAPRQSVAMAQVRPGEAQVRAVKAPDVTVRERQLPGVAEAPAASNATPAASATSSSSGQSNAQATAAAATQGSSAAARPSSQSGTSAGAGPRPQDRSGGWDAPARGDDWGASARQTPGKQGGQADQGKGLFNADGSVRMAGDAGQSLAAPARGAPGGDTDTWSRERIAESGTWLKRPPYEFTPTSFDKYWVPNESLLAEWVRKGVKDIKIPIPGTNTSISCVVSMLQFGGGCSLSNPNMQEQPAEARPPPDIPFKKELQEDNGSR